MDDTTTEGIACGDPPPKQCKGAKPGVTALFVEALKARPGEWAEYQPGRTHSTGSVSYLKARYPGTELTTRSQPDGKCRVWVRWVGTEGGE